MRDVVRVIGLLFNPVFGVLLFCLFCVMIVHFSLQCKDPGYSCVTPRLLRLFGFLSFASE